MAPSPVALQAPQRARLASPKEILRQLEWTVWQALGVVVVEDSGPRYEIAELVAAHLYTKGATVRG